MVRIDEIPPRLELVACVGHIGRNLAAELDHLRAKTRQQHIAGDSNRREQREIYDPDCECARDQPSMPGDADWPNDEFHQGCNEVSEERRQDEEQNHALQRVQHPQSRR